MLVAEPLKDQNRVTWSFHSTGSVVLGSRYQQLEGWPLGRLFCSKAKADRNVGVALKGHGAHGDRYLPAR
jgi:hypothetical protein